MEVDLRAVLAGLVLSGCTGALQIDEDGVAVPGEGWWNDTAEPDADDLDTDAVEDFSGSRMRVVTPESGSFLELGQPATFEARVQNEDNELIEIEDVLWTSRQDASWDAYGPLFDDDRLGVGLHDITAEATLPDGTVLKHTVGGVRVQTNEAGTYVGLFSMDGSYQGLVFTCNGSGTLVVSPSGREITGSGNCLASTLGFDLPIEMLFDLQYDPTTGEIFGDAGVNLFLFTYDFLAGGTIDPDGAGIELDWYGDVPVLSDVTATMTAPRITRDTGLL